MKNLETMVLYPSSNILDCTNYPILLQDGMLPVPPSQIDTGGTVISRRSDTGVSSSTLSGVNQLATPTPNLPQYSNALGVDWMAECTMVDITTWDRDEKYAEKYLEMRRTALKKGESFCPESYGIDEYARICKRLPGIENIDAHSAHVYLNQLMNQDTKCLGQKSNQHSLKKRKMGISSLATH